MKEINWPDNKEFAFSIVDDTDNAFIENIKPVYDLLIKQNLKTTKTIWLYNSRDHFSGDSMENVEYQDFIFDLINHGFEIGLHNVGSGDFKREEIIQGIELFNNILGYYPKIHINHSSNKDNLYWGHKRYGLILNALIKMVYGEKRNYNGHEPTSDYFWGDYSKKYVKYIRNRVFNGINTLNYDSKMPYKEKSKVYSNFWFSSSDGHTIEEFNALISPQNIDKLKDENGLCIVYTHFASGFVDKNGDVNPEFKGKIEYLSEQNGWFASTGDILDFLLEINGSNYASPAYINKLDVKWIIDRVMKKIKYGR